MRGDVAAGVERLRVIDLPRAHPLILQVVGKERRQVRGRLPQEGEPRGDGLLRVSVRLPAEVRRHRHGIGRVRFRLGDARRAHQIVVVDEPGVGVAIDGAAQRQRARHERQVERQTGVGAGDAAVREAEQVAADVQRVVLHVRAGR